MSESDNHVDAGTKLSDNKFSRFDEEILHKYFNEEGQRQVAKYYADFYRGKILAAVRYGWDASGEGWNAEHTGSQNNPYKIRENLALQYLSIITDQFNSKEKK